MLSSGFMFSFLPPELGERGREYIGGEIWYIFQVTAGLIMTDLQGQLDSPTWNKKYRH